MTEHEKEILQMAKDAKARYTKDQFESWLRGFDRPPHRDSKELQAELRKLLEK